MGAKRVFARASGLCVLTVMLATHFALVGMACGDATPMAKSGWLHTTWVLSEVIQGLYSTQIFPNLLGGCSVPLFLYSFMALMRQGCCTVCGVFEAAVTPP